MKIFVVYAIEGKRYVISGKDIYFVEVKVEKQEETKAVKEIKGIIACMGRAKGMPKSFITSPS